MPSNDIFPVLRSCTKLATNSTVYDAKFYPFGTIDDDQIFAVVAERDTFVCRPTLGSDKSFETLRWFRDEDPEASGNSLAWSRDPTTGKPWLCVAGALPRHIKILDVENGKTVRTLAGHGKGVNDLAISPLSTSLLASCAEDTTIRLWNLDAAHEQKPCVALFAGEGHKWPIMAIGFHPNGRWLLSGGQDTAVCLWAVPTIEELEANGTARHEPITIYYPHFFTKELHSNYVDCVSFFGDLIVSRAARDQNQRSHANNIILWRIDGFDPDQPVPDEPPIPVHGQHTRSSFPHNSDGRFRGFQRLLTLDMPHTDRTYHRFGFFNQPGQRPIIAMGNQISQMYFWDLQKFEEGLDPLEIKKGKKGRSRVGASRSESLATSTSTRESNPIAIGTTNANLLAVDTTPAPAERVFIDLADRMEHIEPHLKTTVNTSLSAKLHFATSQVTWSPDGTWMVSAGDNGMICIFHRDRSAVEWGNANK